MAKSSSRRSTKLSSVELLRIRDMHKHLKRHSSLSLRDLKESSILTTSVSPYKITTTFIFQKTLHKLGKRYKPIIPYRKKKL